MRPVRLLLLLALAVAADGALAQPVLDRLTRADGLPSDYVQALFQDRFGFLWIGTDAGLARYDGVSVRTFTADDGLPDPFVYGVAEDLDGTLWVGTYRGLARHEGDAFVGADEPFGHGTYVQLLTDGAGGLTAWTNDAVAVRRDGGWVRGSLPEPASRVVGLGDGRVVATRFESQPSLAALASQSGPTTWSGITGARSALGPLGHGRIVLQRPGTFDVGRFIGRTFEVERRVPNPATAGGPTDRLWGAVELEGGRLIVAAVNGVFWMSDEGPVRISVPRVESLTVDREGGLWLGTFGQGLYRLRGWHLTRLTREPAIRVRTIGDAVWVTHDGLTRVDPVRLTLHTDRDTKARLVDARPDGPLTWSTSVDLTDGASRQQIGHFGGWFSDLDATTDTIWASTYGSGVFRYRAGVLLDTVGVADGLPTGMVERLARTRHGVWALTRSEGAALVTPRGVRVLGRQDGLPGSAVYSLAEVAGAVWVGTDRGLGRWDGERVTSVGTEILNGQHVAALFERPGMPGVVWAVGDRTLYRVDGGRVRAVGGFPLLPDDDVSITDATYHPGTDRLFLATTGGLVAVELAAIPKPAPAPPAAVRAVRVDGQRRALKGTAVEARLAPLAPGHHRVEVDVVALAFGYVPRLEYRIDGADWVPLGREGTLTFTDLGRGRHAVEVRAFGEVEEPSPTARLDLEVRPFWWQRPFVVGPLAVLLFVAFGAAVQTASSRRLRRRLTAVEREAEAERRVRHERARISRDLHDHVGAQLSSLLAGVELVRLGRRGDSGPPEAGDPLDDVESDARETMRQLRETIWALHDEALTASAFCERLEAFVRQQARGRAERVRVECADDGALVLPPAVALGLYRIAQEALTNALKHANAAVVTLRLEATPAGLALVVEDDGTFVEPAGGDGLSGFGLGSMRARAESLGGTFSLDSEAGTRIRVEVPIPLPSLS